MSGIGRSPPRLEDPPLVRGEGCFADDVAFPHMLHMRVVRAHQAHAGVVGIDTGAARATPGVACVWTAADVARIPPIGFRLTGIESLAPYRQPVLAAGRVRYVGEPVAVVFATDPYHAEDAADAVGVELDELDVTLDAAGETGEFAPGVSTEAAVVRKGYGDPDTAFAAAHAVVEIDCATGRHSGVPLETRGAVARYDAARDILEVHGAAKVPHWNRDTVARMLGRAPATVQFFEGHVGGGFGIRGELYPEDVLVAAAALRLRRPVKWIEDRREHLMAANHSREQRHRLRAAVDAWGRFLAVEDVFFHDQGAYLRTHSVTVPDLAAAMLPGPYAVPAYRAEGHVRLTNKTPCGTYRAPGRYESTFARERLVDAVAARLGLDPVEVRRRNFIPPAAMPHDRQLETLGTPVVYDSGDYGKLLDRTLAAVDWETLQARLAERRAAGERVGAGLACFVEKSGLGPFDGVRISVDATGLVEAVTGAASLGQGLETVVAQIAAETLGVDYARVKVVHGQTDRIAYGMGAFASRATVMTGEATRRAAAGVRERALDMAAELLQAPVEALDVAAGEVRGPAGARIGLDALAGHLAPGSSTRGDRAPGLSAEGWFHTDHMTYPYGVHVAVAAVDPATGAVTPERYLVGYDVGRAVNPKLVEGQLAGGVAQGLGGALLEAFRYDAAGEPLALTFADYLMPTAAEVPPVEVLLTEDAPSPLNALGLKGAGEGGANAVGAALAAAVDDALGRPGAVDRLPIDPSWLRGLLRAAGGTDAR